MTEIVRMHKTGRPVLVGTTSVEKSEILSDMLQEAGIKHQARHRQDKGVCDPLADRVRDPTHACLPRTCPC